MSTLIAFCLGLCLGILIMLMVLALQRRDAGALAESMYLQSEQLRKHENEKALEGLRASFAAISQEALIRSGQQFLALAGETLDARVRAGAEQLDGKKQLIDENLGRVGQELKQIEELVHRLERDRENKFGELARQLETAARQTAHLQETAEKLRAALNNSRARGQWGERMADDVLRLAGFVEGVNYVKQRTLEGAGTRPDFTFLLPQGLKINMDVKFPLENYLRFLEAQSQVEGELHRQQFLRDVRNRVREVTGRDYIDPADRTVDYVLLFIPNEQVYGFINDNDRTLLDEALRLRVVLCSPLTLYAILAVVRQAVENFNLERTASQILSLLGAFKKQWDLFATSLDRLGERLHAAENEYDRLATTRRRQLERPLERIEDLRRMRGLPEAAAASDDEPGQSGEYICHDDPEGTE